MKKTLLALSIVSLSMFFTGCTSYSFRGSHTPPPPAAPLSSNQYHLKNYTSDIKWGNGWSIPKGAGRQVIKQEIENELCATYPRRFTKDAGSTPIDVRVRHIDSDVSCWGMIPYFLSLGIYPGNIMRYMDTCEVTVSANGMAKKGEVKFRSNSWLSVWTPWALSRRDSPDAYTGAHRRGNGIMTVSAPGNTCFEHQSEVFTAEIIAEINTKILELENNR